MLEESGSFGISKGLELLNRWSGNLVQQWELDTSLSVSLGVWSLYLVCRDHCSPDDMDSVSASSVSSGHIHVYQIKESNNTHLADCSTEAGITVLLVHVVVASTRLIADDQAVDLHGLVWILLHLRDIGNR